MDVARITDEVLVGETVQAKGERLNVVRTRFRGCRFEDFKPNSFSTAYCEFEDCEFSGTSLDHPGVVRSTFTGCTFDGKIHRLIARKSSFSRCRFTGLLSSCAFVLAPGGVFEDNDFTQAQMRDCSLRGGISMPPESLPLDGSAVVLRASPEAAERAEPYVETIDEQVLMEAVRVCLRTGQTDVLLDAKYAQTPLYSRLASPDSRT